MGDSEKESISESQTQAQQRFPLLIGAIMLIIGLLAPVMINVYDTEWMSQIVIQGMFWMYSFSSSGPYDSGFSTIHPYAFASMFPFLLLRMVPVSQIYRYYNGKTTKKRALIASIVGDGLFLFVGILFLFIGFGYSGMFMIPLPFQVIFGFLVLWRFPIPEPTTPWEGTSEQKSWWDKTPKPQQEKSKDEDELW